MKNNSSVIKVTLCGPGDVSREIEIAEQVITEWNRTNWEATGCGLISRHWRTSSTPDMAERGQRVIDRQLIDDSELVVGIFWSRLGTPTGLADSGTVEEIDRATHRDIRAMVYFSKLEAPAQKVDSQQMAQLEVFRQRVFGMGLASLFTSRRQFEKDFRNHLGLAVHEILAKRTEKQRPRTRKAGISKKGNNNMQVVGDGNTIKTVSAKGLRIVLEQAPGQLTPSEQKRVSDWVDELATLTNNVEGKTMAASKGEWWSRLKNQFDVPRYNALESARMDEVEAWFKASKGRILASTKAKRSGASDAAWKTSIKTRMTAMGRTNEDYYPEIAMRLKIPRFTSLTKLSSKRLKKVYDLVRRDSKK